jgi:hypothetical protein
MASTRLTVLFALATGNSITGGFVYRGTEVPALSPLKGDLGISGATILEPGSATSSVLHARMLSGQPKRMPAIGTSLEDKDATAFIQTWIDGFSDCTGPWL